MTPRLPPVVLAGLMTNGAPSGARSPAVRGTAGSNGERGQDQRVRRADAGGEELQVHGRLVRSPAEQVEAVDDVPPALPGQGLQGHEIGRSPGAPVEQHAEIEAARSEVAECPGGLGRRDEEGRQSAGPRRLFDEADEIRVIFPVVGDGQVVSGHRPQIFLNR